ncbi:hypothetical protein HDU98_002939 [Podochytrium sp. JEL0797]|nr:hypothetical protein HDU98_002939 [Podochytrium sp. JEL0797]
MDQPAQPPATQIPSTLTANPAAFSSVPKSFTATNPQRRQLRKRPISITLKNPNVLDIDTTRDTHALKQLLFRNGEMLKKKLMFVSTLPDKGEKLELMNAQIGRRLDVLESGSLAAQSTPKKLANFAELSPTKSSNDTEPERERRADAMEDLEKMVEGIRLTTRDDDDEEWPGASPHRATKVITLSFEESLKLEKKQVEEERMLQLSLLMTSGMVSNQKKAVETTFDKSKYRAAMGSLPDFDSDDSDWSSDEEEEEEQCYDDG